MASDEVKRLRAEYRRVRGNVSRKISRIAKTGAKVAGTQYDPRQEVGHENRLNAKQLRSAIDKMNAFQNRNVQFIAGAGNAVFAKSEVASFQRKQGWLKQRAEKFTSEMSKTTFPGMDQTPREFQAMLYNRADGYSNNPFQVNATDIGHIKNLKKLEAHIDKQLKPEFFSKKLEESRASLIKAWIINGEDQEDIQGLRELSEFQFAMLWYGSTAAEESFIKYASVQAIELGEGTERDLRIVERSNIRQFLKDAKSLPPDRFNI